MGAGDGNSRTWKWNQKGISCGERPDSYAVSERRRKSEPIEEYSVDFLFRSGDYVSSKFWWGWWWAEVDWSESPAHGYLECDTGGSVPDSTCKYGKRRRWNILPSVRFCGECVTYNAWK